MTSRSIPWQFEWKRPEWQSPSEHDDDEAKDYFVDGVPIWSTSAQVTFEEAQEWQSDRAAEENPDGSFLLVATLYSTGNKHQSADVLLLELIRHEQGPKRLKYRMLRWPASTMSSEEPEKSSWWMGGRKGRKQVVGLVSVTLCRRPVGEDLSAFSAADAMDVVALLSLGLETTESSAVHQKAVEPEENEQESDPMPRPDKPSELILACLTSDGSVLFYSIQTIFQPNKENEGETLENGLASLLLGNDIHRQLEQSVLPLSQPLSVVPLSVPLKSNLQTTRQNDNLAVIPEDFELIKDEVYEEEDTSVQQDLWEGSFWDANVEASTAKYHSVENDPKLLISAFDFIAVAGQGTRIQRAKRRRKKVPSSSRGSSVSSWEIASHQGEEKYEISAKAHAHTGDTVDSSGWWQDNQVQTTLMDDESSDNTTKREEKSKTKWFEYREAGGFVTFISNRYYAETRTVFLPFAPKQLSAIIWGGLHFVVVLGDESLAPAHAPLALAIRVDSFDIMKIPQGESPSTMLTREPSDADASNALPSDKQKRKRNEMCSVRRFHLIPILLPSKGSSSFEQVTAVAISSTMTDPPAIALQYSSQPELSGDLLITLNSFRSLDVVPAVLTHRATGGYRRFGKEPEKGLAIRTHQEQEHVARIPHAAEPSTTRNTWCHVGQGWALLGIDDDVYFICWEGSTATQGSFVTRIHSEEEYESKVDALTTLRLFAPVVSTILPLQNIATGFDHETPGAKYDGRRPSNLHLPFTSPYKLPSFVTKRRKVPGVESMPEDASENEDILKEALESLAMDNRVMEQSQKSFSRSRQSLSYRERSVRLVRHCSSWTLLDDTEENKTHYDGQVPVMVVQLGPLLREHFILSMRKVVVDNATASPFNQVLGWLSQSKDYYTAASVALDLLQDVDSLRDLRRVKAEAGLDRKRANLEGLLDGIIPLDSGRLTSSPSPCQSVLTQLADMSVGCLLKGGLSMSSTLENFVHNNACYDTNRTCLMLVATTVCTLSRDPKIIKSVMGAEYGWPANDVVPIKDLLWPLRCLFRVGVSRECLPTILQLLNASIPDELRRRGLDGSTPSKDAREICSSIVSMTISSSATELLLDLRDEATGKRYWASLDVETRLDLSLIRIEGMFPLLRQSEVRSWALSEIDYWIQCNASREASTDRIRLTDEWLQTLCEACLANAGCDLDYVESESFSARESDQSGGKTNDDGMQEHFETNLLAIEALSPSSGVGGLDFDLLIAALLLLVNRSVAWRRNSCLTTQNMLDASCYLAGRHRKEEPAFAFDGQKVMKQCAMSGNISAGANLIGGKNGLVLKCCDILMKGAGTSMDDSEDFILNDDLAGSTLWTKAKHGKRHSAFQLTDEHRSVLWLLDEYVLSVKTFGDFDTTHVRGKVDPIFAARSCLRTWFLLSIKQTSEATAWLVNWLRTRLAITDKQVSPKRLACSALTCALVWPTSDEVIDVGDLDVTSDETLLATALDMESLFLVQLSQSCCGLVEAVPPSFAHEILRQVEAAEARESRTASFQLDV